MLAWSWPTPAAWECRTGYGYQYKNRQRPNNYQVHPFLPSAVVPMGRVVGPSWLRGRWAWQPELFLALFTHPYVRPILGLTPLQFRCTLEPLGRWSPYGLLGAGVLYANVNREETSGDLNFNLQGALGLQVALSKDVALLVEYRHIHLSNAGLHEENSGLNTHTFLAGLSLQR